MPNGISTSFDIVPEEAVISTRFEPEGISTKFDAPLEPETTLGGVVTSIGAGALAGATQLAQIPVSGLQIIEDITGLGLFGKELDKIIDDTRDFWIGKIGKSKAEQLIGQAAQTISTIGTTAAALALTAGSTAGLLPVLAAGAGLETTAEALEEGEAPRLNAYGAGIVSAATEFLTEKIPIGLLQKPGISFMKRLVGGAIADVPGELIATAVDMKVINEDILGKEPVPIEDFIDILKDTAAVSVLSTIGLSGGAQAIQASLGKPPPAPAGEAPDVSAPDNIADAIQEIVAPPPSETIVPEEKVDIVDPVARETAKSEYPELNGQLDVVSQDQTFDPTDNIAIEKEVPEQNLYEKKPYEDLNWVKIGKEADAYSNKQRGFSRGKLWRAFIRGFVDVSGNIKAELNKLGNEGKRAAMQRDAQAGAHSKAIAILDPIRREIFGGIKREHRQMFDLYLSALRHQEIRANKGAQFKLPGNATEQDLQDFIDAIPPNLMEGKDGFAARAERWSNRMGQTLELMQREGLLTDEQTIRLREQGKFYVPRQVLDLVDPTTTSLDRQGRTITVRDSGLKNLTEDGSDKLIETDTELLLQQIYERAYTRVFKNRANLEMLNVARTQPNNGIVTERVRGRELRSNESTISVMEDGIRRELIMPKDMAREWVRSDPIITAQQANIIGWLTGTKMLKSMATTLNPEFAITNIPRDIAHIYLTTDQYSSFAPKFALQMASDVIKVAKDAITKTGLYNTYIDNGGGTEFLTYQGRVAKGKGVLNTLESIMGFAGERSEILTRLALMNRAIKNKKSNFEATQIARGYLDFSQGGSIAKAIDSALPFFNAGIQATRGIFRAAKADKKAFGFKIMNLGMMATSLYWANRFMYGDDIEDVTDDEQKNNWIVMTPFTFLDRNKEERRYYVRIPKDQGQRVFTSIFEGFAKKSLGLPVDGDQIADAAKDFIPVSAYELMPPTVEAIMGYAVNKDFWRREDIWRGPDVLPQDEYNKYTPETYVQLGESTGLSPVRMKYALDQVFTQGNIWTSLVGFGAEQVFSDLTPEQRADLTKEMLERKPGVRRFLKSTRPDIKREKALKQQKIELASQRKRVNDEFDIIVDRFFEGQTERREVFEFIRRQPVENRAPLRTRFKDMRRMKDVPNRRFWLGLKSLPPESRATNYWNQWVQLDDQGRKELDRMSRKVPGFRSKRFLKSFNRQKRLGGRQ
jgi:hypothetical protein